MIAELGLHQAVVTGLADIVKAPVVESRHHLPLLNPGVQAAARGRAVLRMGLGKLSEALLALVALLKLL